MLINTRLLDLRLQILGDAIYITIRLINVIFAQRAKAFIDTAPRNIFLKPYSAELSKQPWQIATLMLELIKMTTQSIAGVTYMDHFDFEQRYRDAHECNPFYWHPLHLPEDCAEMYEDLIHSRIASRTPIRIVRERQDIIYKLNTHQYVHEPLIYKALSVEAPYYEFPKLTPYEKMFAYLKSDITKHPKAPTIELMPNLGPVAVYRQPISKKSKTMIKKIAQAYSDVFPTYERPGEFFGKIDVKDGKFKGHSKIEMTTNSHVPTGPVKITKKFKNGNIVTIKTMRK